MLSSGQPIYDASLMAAVRGHGHTWPKKSDISNWFWRRAERVSVLLAAAEIFDLTLVGPKNAKIIEPNIPQHQLRSVQFQDGCCSHDKASIWAEFMFMETNKKKG